MNDSFVNIELFEKGMRPSLEFSRMGGSDSKVRSDKDFAELLM